MATDDSPTDPGPPDTDLLALGGWKDVPTARILARSFDDQFGVVVLDSNGPSPRPGVADARVLAERRSNRPATQG
jgi:hypothetical protein